MIEKTKTERQMTFREKLQSVYDFWRPNRYGLKPYLVNDRKKHPFAVICPGGAYRMVCSYVEGLPFAKELNKLGCHALVVYYRTKGRARYPDPQEDLKRAVLEAFSRAEEWELETEGWSLWGSSAGGHLAASFCTEDRGTPKPSALILIYPVITMGDCTHAETRSNLLGKDADPALIEKLSVEKHISSEYPPTFVWNGTADSSVDPANSRMLEAALAEAGVPHKAEEFEGIGHGVGLARGTNAEVWFSHAVSFWEEQRSKAAHKR